MLSTQKLTTAQIQQVFSAANQQYIMLEADL